MDNIKIIFFDIDGTLIDMERKKISDKMLETLIRLKERNIILCIGTGRGPLQVPHFDGVEFDAFMTFNGSYCYNRKEVIFSNAIPHSDVKKIIQNGKELNKPVSVSTKDKMVANGKDDDLVEYFAFSKTLVNVSDSFDEVINNDDVYQIMISGTKEQYPFILKDCTNAKITAWWDRAVDIIPSNSGKGVGVEQILKYYGLDKSQSMAFGDGNNDIEMIAAAGHGIAMANASDDLKAIAGDICGHVKDDGIYHYCIDHQLI